MANDGPNIPNFSRYKNDLFDGYKNARYYAMNCTSLMRRAVRTEKWVRWSVLILVAVSLITGSTSHLNPPILSPLWAFFGALATLLSVYSLVVASGTKQFFWYDLASKFLELAGAIDLFSKYVEIGKVTESEILEQWADFSNQQSDLLNRGNVELREYTEKNEKWLTERLEEILKREGKIDPRQPP